jgi:hypothetical protein
MLTNSALESRASNISVGITTTQQRGDARTLDVYICCRSTTYYSSLMCERAPSTRTSTVIESSNETILWWTNSYSQEVRLEEICHTKDGDRIRAALSEV